MKDNFHGPLELQTNGAKSWLLPIIIKKIIINSKVEVIITLIEIKLEL